MPYGSGVMEIHECTSLQCYYFYLLHVLFIFTWLCAVNVPKFIVDNIKKKGLFLNTKIEI